MKLRFPTGGLSILRWMSLVVATALLTTHSSSFARQDDATNPQKAKAAASKTQEDENGEATEAKASAAEPVVEAPDVQAIIDAGRNDCQVQNHLDVLCNRIGPRLTSSEGLQTACEWALEKFQSLGLQNCRLEQWGEFPVGFQRGPSIGQMLEPKEMDIEFGTNSWTPGTKGRTVGIVVAGPTNQEEFDSIKDKLSGSWVLMPSIPFRRGMPPEELEAIRTLRDAVMDCKPLGIIRSTRDELIVTSGRYQVDWDNLPTIPEINIVKSQYDEIAQLVSDGKEVKLAFDIRNYFRKGPIPLYNVIAEIPGSETPDEYVVVGGHIDSWDGATGATDNGTGCATTIEAARILMASGVKPKRTIRFMLWSGEEQGLLGSAPLSRPTRTLSQKCRVSWCTMAAPTTSQGSAFLRRWRKTWSRFLRRDAAGFRLAIQGRRNREHRSCRRQRSRLVHLRRRSRLFLATSRSCELSRHPPHAVRYLRQGHPGIPTAFIHRDCVGRLRNRQPRPHAFAGERSNNARKWRPVRIPPRQPIGWRQRLSRQCQPERGE